MSRIRWAGTDYPIKYGTDVLVQAARAEMLEDNRCWLSGYSGGCGLNGGSAPGSAPEVGEAHWMANST